MTSMQNVHEVLSFGALKRILVGEKPEDVVLQILGYKQIPGSNNNRFRLLLNDGTVLFPYAILATQLNSLIYDNHLEKYTVFRLKEYEYSQLLPNKKIIICIDIEILILGSEVKEKISKENSPCVNKQNVSVPALKFAKNHHPVTFEPCPSTSYDSQNWDIASSNAIFPTNNETATNFCFISSLSPYRSKWTIKARISYKTHIIKYSKMLREGKYFAFHLLDESGEIRAVAFDVNAEKYYELLEVFKIYIISNAAVKPALGNCLLKCDFEMIIDNRTKIEPCTDNESSIPMPTFNFRTIKQITSLPKDSCTDVIGICSEISNINSILTKYNNEEVSKRTICLIDKSKISISVTLWGANAENFTVTDNPVVAIRNAKVTNFRGCSLMVSPMSMIYVNPAIHKTYELRSWFQTVGSCVSRLISFKNSQPQASQNWKTIAEAHTHINENTDAPLYHTTKGTIVMVKKETCMYQACSSPGCLKKVQDLYNGLYRCHKCNVESNTFHWMYMLHLQVSDFTGSQWVLAFREVAENLIGLNAEELNKIKSEDEDKYFDILNKLNLRSYIFKMRSSFETYNENTRLKTSILSFSPVEPVAFTKKLLNDIKKMNIIVNNS